MWREIEVFFFVVLFYFSMRKRERIMDFNWSLVDIGVIRFRFESCSRESSIRSSGELKIPRNSMIFFGKKTVNLPWSTMIIFVVIVVVVFIGTIRLINICNFPFFIFFIRLIRSFVFTRWAIIGFHLWSFCFLIWKTIQYDSTRIFPLNFIRTFFSSTFD